MPHVRKPRKQGRAEASAGRGPRRAPGGEPAAPRKRSAVPLSRFEAEVLPGLAKLAAAELEKLGAAVAALSDDAIGFTYAGPVGDLLQLKLAVAIHRVLSFEVPRPKALLGHEHFSRLVGLVRDLERGPPAQRFEGFRFGAAGSDSAVFRRLAAAVEQDTGLEYSEEGELLLRFRPAGDGWEVLGRLTRRPLSARPWRACNRAGGLNATVAAAGLELLGRVSGERHLNLMCGSGTLLVERGSAGAWQRGVGLDIDPQALDCARRNLESAGLADRSELFRGDAVSLPFAAASFDRLSVDLPWGDAIGAHEENARLYPAFLSESARVAGSGARMLAITHELRLFDRAVAGSDRWRLLGEPMRVFHGGHRPGLYLLELSK